MNKLPSMGCVPRIPILTLWQPWASWIAYGQKAIESRTHDKFKGLVGKTIGIHASLRWDKDALETAGCLPEGIYSSDKRDYPFGCILCTAYVTEHRRLTQRDDVDAMLINADDIEERYGLFLECIVRIEPFFVKGQQGIWYCPEFDDWLSAQ